MALLRNSIRCKKCDDVIESQHRHDFVSCGCGSVAVDGGLDYQRFLWPGGGKIEDWIEDLSEEDDQ